MLVYGANAVQPGTVLEAMRECAFAGRACLVWCDGEEVIGVFAQEGEGVDDVLRVAPKVMPQ